MASEQTKRCVLLSVTDACGHRYKTDLRVDRNPPHPGSVAFGTGIRVNVLSPGATDTPGLNALAPGEEQNRAFKAVFAEAIPLGRVGEPEELAAAALFLASDESSFVNGSELFADGGMAQV